MKKILALCMIFCIMFVIPTQVFATTDLDSETIEVIEYTQSELEEYSNTPTPDGIPATEINDETDSSYIKSRVAIESALTPVFIRESPNSVVVQVYLAYVGIAPGSLARFDEMTIQNTNLIFQETYGTLTPRVYDARYPLNTVFFYIGLVAVPTDVDEVRVQDSGMQVFVLGDDPGWHSFSNIIGKWPIQ